MFFSSSLGACELSKEYKELRTQIARDARYPYQECIDSVGRMYYWKEVARCEADGGSEVGGGCQHVAGRTVPKIPDSETKHCEILKVSWEEIEKYFNQYVEEKNITKCSTSQPSAAGQPKASLLPAG